MIKKCDAEMLSCPNGDKRVAMKVAVNFNGKLRSYCCVHCANDDIGEHSDGADYWAKAVREGDAFLLAEWNEKRNEPEIASQLFGASGVRND
jgi:hypothetical protein